MVLSRQGCQLTPLRDELAPGLQIMADLLCHVPPGWDVTAFREELGWCGDPTDCFGG